MSISVPTLDSPFIMGNGIVVKNRLFKSAMTENLADRFRNPTAYLLRLYRAWSSGGVGMSVSGSIMVDRATSFGGEYIVLDERSPLLMFRKWASAGTENNAVLWAQLDHPGIQFFKRPGKSRTTAPGARFKNGAVKHDGNLSSITEKDIFDIIAKFAVSARLAKEVGFSGVQLDSSRGHLLNQFVSQQYNNRDDSWGGTFDNRMRFLRELYREIRKLVGDDFPISIKFDSRNIIGRGIDSMEVKEMLKILSEEKFDLIEVSKGIVGERDNQSSQPLSNSIDIGREVIGIAAWIKSYLDVPLVLTGGFRSVERINGVLREGIADFVGLARPLAIDPELPRKLIDGNAYNILLKHVTTGVQYIDQVFSIDTLWYEHQLARIARGKPPCLYMNEWLCIVKAILSYLRWMLTGRHSI